MKSKTTLRVIASALALMLLFAAIPFAALAEGTYPLIKTAANSIANSIAGLAKNHAAVPTNSTSNEPADYPVKTPEGYNEHEYQKLRAFLETTDPDGVKNGEKLSDDYDPDDPSTWRGIAWIDSDDGKRIKNVSLSDQALYGQLDLSGCTRLSQLYCYNNRLTELDVSGCTALEELVCSDNRLTELDVSGCTALRTLYCDFNQLTELDFSSNTTLYSLSCGHNQLTKLDVSNCTALWGLACNNNQLTELDVSSNTKLKNLWCEYNQLTELDLSNNPYLLINSIIAEGNGFISCYGWGTSGSGWYTVAVPAKGSFFLGWYDTDGNLLSMDLVFNLRNCSVTDFVAKFTLEGNDPDPTSAPTPTPTPTPTGDVDGDGEITTIDALIALRSALGLDTLTDEQLTRADVNGDGVVTAADALIILRIALGLIQP